MQTPTTAASNPTATGSNPPLGNAPASRSLADVRRATAATPRWRRYARRLRIWTVRGFATFGFLVFIYALCFDLSAMVSPSMSPTLKGTNVDNGDRILTEKVSLWFRRPRRLEVITFLNNDGVRVMKRVIGLPGEHVQVSDDDQLMIDGVPLVLPDSVDKKYIRYGNLTDRKPIACNDGYYVLGDFTSDSDDSRFNGPVQPNRIIGRAWLIVSPWARFGFVR